MQTVNSNIKMYINKIVCHEILYKKVLTEKLSMCNSFRVKSLKIKTCHKICIRQCKMTHIFVHNLQTVNSKTKVDT